MNDELIRTKPTLTCMDINAALCRSASKEKCRMASRINGTNPKRTTSDWLAGQLNVNDRITCLHTKKGVVACPCLPTSFPYRDMTGDMLASRPAANVPCSSTFVCRRATSKVTLSLECAAAPGNASPIECSRPHPGNKAPMALVQQAILLEYSWSPLHTFVTNRRQQRAVMRRSGIAVDEWKAVASAANLSKMRHM